MNLQNRRALKDAAAQSLLGSNGKQLILLHTGIAIAFSAFLSILDYLLESGIGATAGLGGIGLRSTFTTVQTMLRFGHLVFLPFWQIGYLYATLLLAKKEHASPDNLLEGFRCFGVVFRYQLIAGLIIFGVLLVSGYAASTVYFMTPLSAPLRETILPLLTEEAISQDPVALAETVMSVTQEHILPMLILTAAIAFAIGIPLFYHYRMASLCLMDEPNKGAISALRASRKMMRRNCLDMFRLDLSFWWFYLLEMVIGFISYTDVFLNAINRPLPIPQGAQYFLFYGISLAGQLALYYFCKNNVFVTYAHAYFSLKPREETSQVLYEG